MQGHTELVVQFDRGLEAVKGEHDFAYALRLTRRIAADLFGRDLIKYEHAHHGSAHLEVRRPAEGIQEALDSALREAFETERITINYGRVDVQTKPTDLKKRRLGIGHNTLAHLAAMEVRDHNHAEKQEPSYSSIVHAAYRGRQELL